MSLRFDFRWLLLFSVTIISPLRNKNNKNSKAGYVDAMRIVVQRVKSASVTSSVDNTLISQIGPGLVALVGIHETDTIDDIQYCCKHLLGCKIFDNANGVAWRQNVKQKQYECLCVSQFTLYGTVSKKTYYKPDYKLAMKTAAAQELYHQFLALLRSEYAEDTIKDGRFGTMMDVALVNDGPVTIIIESNNNTTNNTTNSSIETPIDNKVEIPANGSNNEEEEKQEPDNAGKDTAS